MYDNLDFSSLSHVFNHSPYHRQALNDIDSVEPWSRVTEQITINSENKQKNVKTFYHSHFHQNQLSDKKSFTQRGFTFRRQGSQNKLAALTHNSQSENEKRKSHEKKIIVSQYYIDGDFMLDHQTNNGGKFPVKFKSIRLRREKTRSISEKQSTPARISLTAMRKRVSLNKPIASILDLMPNKQLPDSAHKRNVVEPKKSKVIALGFQKFSKMRGMIKQKSFSVSVAERQDL